MDDIARRAAEYVAANTPDDIHVPTLTAAIEQALKAPFRTTITPEGLAAARKIADDTYLEIMQARGDWRSGPGKFDSDDEKNHWAHAIARAYASGQAEMRERIDEPAEAKRLRAVRRDVADAIAKIDPQLFQRPIVKAMLDFIELEAGWRAAQGTR